VSVGVTGEHVVAKEGKTARELIALVKNELHIKEVELESIPIVTLVGMPGAAWTTECRECSARSRKVVKRLRRLCDLI
jgi:hypothetical protein